MLYYSYSRSFGFINPALRPTAANKTEGRNARMNNNQHNERKFECALHSCSFLLKPASCHNYVFLITTDTHKKTKLAPMKTFREISPLMSSPTISPSLICLLVVYSNASISAPLRINQTHAFSALQMSLLGM